jgi:TIR domain
MDILTEVYENNRLLAIRSAPRNSMHVFISWSGERSKRAALGLKSLLDDMLGDTVNVFVSQHIKPGENWTRRLGEELDQSEYGVLCLTQENFQAPWLLFEAGAIAKKFGTAHIVPYLVDSLPDDLEGSPLAQFQFARADREGTYALVKGISEELTIPRAGQRLERLERYFDKFWPDLEETIKNLPNPPQKRAAERSDREIIEKISQQVSILVEARKDSSGLSRTEMLHLLNLRDQPTLQYKLNDQLRKELRHLRDIGLIKNKGAIASLPTIFQLDKFFNLTDAGVKYLRESGNTK